MRVCVYVAISSAVTEHLQKPGPIVSLEEVVHNTVDLSSVIVNVQTNKKTQKL